MSEWKAKKQPLKVDLDKCKIDCENLELDKDKAIELLEGVKSVSCSPIPIHIQTNNQLVRSIKFCRDFKLPLSYLHNIFFTNGKISISSSLALSIGLRIGYIKEIDEFLFDDKSSKICEENKNLCVEAFGAFCRVKRREGVDIHKIFTKNDASKAGLMNKDIYKKWLPDMLAHKARIRAINSACPDLLGDINYSNEDFNQKPSEAKEMIEDNIKEDEEIESIIDKKEEEAVVSKPLDQEKVAEAKVNKTTAKASLEKKEKADSSVDEPKEKDAPRTEVVTSSPLQEKIEYFRTLEKLAREKNLISAEIKLTDEILTKNGEYSLDAYIERASKLLEGEK